MLVGAKNIFKCSLYKKLHCILSIQNSQVVKKCVAPKSLGEKRNEIKGGGQEMAVIIVQWKFF